MKKVKNYDKKIKNFNKNIETVFTAKRGIFTNPPKEGNATTPGILFSVLENNYKKSDYVKPIPEKRSRSADKGDERFAFKPASLAIDAPFEADKQVYGENEKEICALVEKSLEVFFSFLELNLFI